MEKKLTFSGLVIGIQPRIRLTRSFDQRYHSYLGFLLRIGGTVGERPSPLTVGIGNVQQVKHAIRAGDSCSGMCSPVENPRLEPVEYYKVSRFRILSREPVLPDSPPPWRGLPPSLQVYQERGHRRLAARPYESNCTTCIWGCRMAVEMIIDQWNPGQRRYRQETFCYGPKSCRWYCPGPQRKVPGRRGMTWTEEDWVDEDATSHRGADD